MIARTLFNADHESFRDSFRRFMDKEIAPFHAEWEEQGYVDREVWRKAGANGFLCMTMPEDFGGASADKLYSVVQMEELSAGGFTGIGFGLHNEIAHRAIHLSVVLGLCFLVFPRQKRLPGPWEWIVSAGVAAFYPMLGWGVMRPPGIDAATATSEWRCFSIVFSV